MVVEKPYLLPGLYLSIGVNVWGMAIRPSRGVNGSGLGYQKRTRECRTLRVIVYTEFGVNMILSRSRAGEGCKDDAMRNGQPTDFQGSEKSRRVDGRRHVSLELSESRRAWVCWSPTYRTSAFYTLQIPRIGEARWSYCHRFKSFKELTLT